jgi:hydroxypyruvate reductase
MNARRILLDCFDAALRAVDGRSCTARELLRFERRRCALFSVGKAASAMTLGAIDDLREHVASALVVTKDDHVDPALLRDPRVRIFESAHPVPDERSLAAGAALTEAVHSLEPGVFPVFLVSGGSSSLVEWLHDGVSLDDLRELNERGLASGCDIGTLNRERAKLSRIKGGGIARLLAGRPALALFVSDVPGDDPDVIGSGLLGAVKDSGDRIERVVIANVGTAVRAAVDAAAARGMRFAAGTQPFDGDASAVAADFLEALRATEADGLVWGGESTVTLPARPGRGGRNSHLALDLARALRPNENITVLAAGTDGTDGPTSDAGALVDAGTIERAELGGCDVERAFQNFDSGTALEAAEDLVHTGPTGTNVGDLLIGCKRTFRML